MRVRSTGRLAWCQVPLGIIQPRESRRAIRRDPEGFRFRRCHWHQRPRNAGSIDQRTAAPDGIAGAVLTAPLAEVAREHDRGFGPAGDVIRQALQLIHAPVVVLWQRMRLHQRVDYGQADPVRRYSVLQRRRVLASNEKASVIHAREQQRPVTSGIDKQPPSDFLGPYAMRDHGGGNPSLHLLAIVLQREDPRLTGLKNMLIEDVSAAGDEGQSEGNGERGLADPAGGAKAPLHSRAAAAVRPAIHAAVSRSDRGRPMVREPTADQCDQRCDPCRSAPVAPAPNCRSCHPSTGGPPVEDPASLGWPAPMPGQAAEWENRPLPRHQHDWRGGALV
jgi:hypothetical protein